jgi:hypothetical protein
MEQLTFEQFKAFLKTLTREQMREIQQIILEGTYRQAPAEEPAPPQEEETQE